MKKSNLIIIILFIILMVCCVCVGWLVSLDKKLEDNTLNNNLILTCDDDEIKKNEDIVCSLKGNATDYEVSAISLLIEKNPDFELLEVLPDPSWEGEGDLGDVDLYTDVNKKDTFNILTFRISLTSDTVNEINIGIIDGSFFDEDFKEHKLQDVNKVLVVSK